VELLFELLGTLLWELLIQAIGEFIAEAGLGSMQHGLSSRRQRNPVVTAMGLMLLGAILGGVSVWLLPERFSDPGMFRGISLVVGPIVLGFMMDRWGRFRRSRGHQTTGLATFHGGAAFAFGVAVVRFFGTA
jgi:hypothetical protein